MINVVGTNDRVTISNWYLNNAYQLDYVVAGASLVSNDEFDQLVSAMSQYTMPTGRRQFCFARRYECAATCAFRGLAIAGSEVFCLTGEGLFFLTASLTGNNLFFCKCKYNGLT